MSRNLRKNTTPVLVPVTDRSSRVTANPGIVSVTSQVLKESKTLSGGSEGL